MLTVDSIRKNGRDLRLVQADGATEYAEWAGSRLPSGAHATRARFDRTVADIARGGGDWANLQGTWTLQRFAAEYVSQGWQQGAERMEEAIANVAIPPMTNVRRRNTWAAEGDEYHPEKTWNGQLDTAWRRTTRRSVSAPPRLRVVIELTAPCSSKGAALFWRGAAGCVIAQALVTAGYAVEVLAVDVNRRTDGDTDTCSVITLKPFDAPFDLASLAAVTAHAAFFRGAVFAGLMRLCDKKAATGGLGQCVTLEASGWGAEVLASHGEARTFTVPYMVQSADMARAWVNRIAAELEGTL